MRDSQQPPDEEPPELPEHGAGRVHPTRPGPLVGFALVGLVAGWLVRPVSLLLGTVAPTVGWLPVLALLFVAAVLGAVAWSTYRTLHPRPDRRPDGRPDRRRGGPPPQPLAPHQAVNRLVLAKACALAGAALAGGYLGHALGWWGVSEAALVQQRIIRSLVGGVAGALIVVTALLLERACRVDRERR